MKNRAAKLNYDVSSETEIKESVLVMLSPSFSPQYPRRHKTSNQGIEGYHPGQRFNRKESVEVLFSDQIIRNQNKIIDRCASLGIGLNDAGNYIRTSNSDHQKVVDKVRFEMRRHRHQAGSIDISNCIKIPGKKEDSRRYQITINSKNYKSMDNREVSLFNIVDKKVERYSCTCGAPNTLKQPCKHIILVMWKQGLDLKEYPKHILESELIRCYQVRL